jgi:hypothetical protein
MPEGRGELELGLQPMVERPSYRFAFLLPDKIGAQRDFIFGCLRTSVEHMHFCRYRNQRKRGQLFDDPPVCGCHFVAISRRKDVCTTHLTQKPFQPALIALARVSRFALYRSL